MVHRPCAAPGLGIDAAACPRARDRQIGRRSIILSKSPLFVEAPCNSPPIECLSSFLFPIISRTAPSGLDRGPIFISRPSRAQIERVEDAHRTSRVSDTKSSSRASPQAQGLLFHFCEELCQVHSKLGCGSPAADVTRQLIAASA